MPTALLCEVVDEVPVVGAREGWRDGAPEYVLRRVEARLVARDAWKTMKC